MNSCVQYKVSTTWLLYLALVHLYWLPLHIICTNICYNLLSFIIINCDNAHLPGFLCWCMFAYGSWSVDSNNNISSDQAEKATSHIRWYRMFISKCGPCNQCCCYYVVEPNWQRTCDLCAHVVWSSWGSRCVYILLRMLETKLDKGAKRREVLPNARHKLWSGCRFWT